MDQELLRRDEMWVAERDASGASSLWSFSDFKEVRYDKDIRKSYLQGRLGGVPRLLLHGAISPAHIPNEKVLIFGSTSNELIKRTWGTTTSY
jgi:hypothetical protein